jgi:tellurite resistance protein
MMTTFKRRQQVSYIQDLEHSVSVANAVANVAANVAAFIVEVAVERRLLRRRMTNRGSVPEWTF